MAKIVIQEELIRRFILIHGYKYNYSKVIFLDMQTKIIIICPIHGEFLQTPANHLGGHGCPECGNNYRINLYKSNTEEFIEKARLIHGDKYDYSKVVYINAHTKVVIICPVHGEFEQTPNSHLSGQGCKKCSIISMINLKTFTTEEFIPKAIEIHGDKNDYSKFIYINSWIKGCITCLVDDTHGDYWQSPNTHLSGVGCPKCKSSKGEKALIKIFKKYKIEAIHQFKLPHHTYEYDFYLPEYNLLIEFHGRQHFQPVEHFGWLEGLKKTQERDAFKKSLARDYNIPIVYFTYKHFKLSKEEFEQFVLMVLNKIIK